MITHEKIEQSLSGELGEASRLICETGLSIIETLLSKNADYGSSAWQSPILSKSMTAREGIQCRMSDKIARLSQLLSGPGVKAEVDETIEDTMRDLAGYSLLWLGCPQVEEERASEVEQVPKLKPKPMPKANVTSITNHP